MIGFRELKKKSVCMDLLQGKCQVFTKPQYDTVFCKIASFITLICWLTIVVIKSITGLDGGQEQQKNQANKDIQSLRLTIALQYSGNYWLTKKD